MGCVQDIASNPITQIGTDIVLGATGQGWAIPLANAAETKLGGGSNLDALKSGGLALAGQEVAGAVGIGEGNSVFNDAAGITWDNPSSLGLPDIGSGISNAFNSASDALGFTSGGTASSVAGSVNATGAPVDAGGINLSATNPVSTSTMPGAGGGFTGANAALGASSNSITSTLANNLSDVPNFSTVASPELGTLSGAAADSTLQAAGSTGGGSGSAASFPGIVGGNVPLSSDAGIGASSTDSLGSTTDNLTLAAGAAASPAGAASPGLNLGGAPTSGASGGLKDWLPSKSDVGGALVKSALPIGALAYDAIKGPSGLPESSGALQPGGAATAPLLSLEQSAADQATTGKLTQPQQAQIQQYIEGAQNQLLQQLASSGSTDPSHDSRYIAGMQQIQQQAMALQQQFIQQAIQTAVSAGGAASNNIATVANQQITNDKDFSDSLAAAFAGLGGGVSKAA